MKYLARLQFVIHSSYFRNCLAVLEDVDLWILKDRQELDNSHIKSTHRLYIHLLLCPLILQTPNQISMERESLDKRTSTLWPLTMKNAISSKISKSAVLWKMGDITLQYGHDSRYK